MAKQFRITPLVYKPGIRVLGKSPIDGQVLVTFANTGDLYWLADNGELSFVINNGVRVEHALFLNSGTILTYGVGSVRRIPPPYTNVSHRLSVATGWPLFRGWDKNPNDLVLAAMYTTNSRELVQYLYIYKGTNDGNDWEVVQTSPRVPHPEDPNTIWHHHTVRWDTYSQLFWIGTGDWNHEVKVWTTIDGTTLTLIGGGAGGFHQAPYHNQQWRQVSFMFTEHFVHWGMDGWISIDPHTGQSRGTSWMVRYNKEKGGEPDYLFELPSITFLTDILDTPFGKLHISSSTLEPHANLSTDKVHIYFGHNDLGWYEVINWDTFTSGWHRLFECASFDNGKIAINVSGIVDENIVSYPEGTTHVTIIADVYQIDIELDSVTITEDNDVYSATAYKDGQNVVFTPEWSVVSGTGTVTAHPNGTATVDGSGTLRCADADDATIYAEVVFGIALPTLSAPSITGNSATVTANGLTEAHIVTLFARIVGEAEFTAYPMTLIEGTLEQGTWVVELPLSPGTWEIYAEADGVQSATVTYEIETPLVEITSVQISQPQSVNPLRSQVLSAIAQDEWELPVEATLSWEVESGQAEITDHGNGSVSVTPKSLQNVTVRCSVQGHPDIYAEVTIEVLPYSVVIAPSSFIIRSGQKVPLKATVRDKNGEIVTDLTVKWTSLDPHIATVDADGTVQSINGGHVRVRADVDSPQEGVN